eukprot:5161446-Lingulodinium_polyedra.AAC.1
MSPAPAPRRAPAFVRWGGSAPAREPRHFEAPRHEPAPRRVRPSAARLPGSDLLPPAPAVQRPARPGS